MAESNQWIDGCKAWSRDRVCWHIAGLLVLTTLLSDPVRWFHLAWVRPYLGQVRYFRSGQIAGLAWMLFPAASFFRRRTWGFVPERESGPDPRIDRDGDWTFSSTEAARRGRVSFSLGARYGLRIACSGNDALAPIDGVRVACFAGCDHTAGFAALGSSHDIVDFDDLSIQRLQPSRSANRCRPRVQSRLRPPASGARNMRRRWLSTTAPGLAGTQPRRHRRVSGLSLTSARRWGSTVPCLRSTETASLDTLSCPGMAPSGGPSAGAELLALGRQPSSPPRLRAK